MLKVFSNDYEWVIAKDFDDVVSILKTEMGVTAEYINEEDWYECHNLTTVFPIFNDETNSAEPLTFAEWINKNGRGYLATTEF